MLALVDWNTAGLAILCTDKYGTIYTGLESYRYACSVKWLGLRGGDLQIMPQQAMIQLTSNDMKIAKSLRSSKFLQGSYQAELAMMTEKGLRAEIEALYCHGFDFLGKYIVKKIVRLITYKPKLHFKMQDRSNKRGLIFWECTPPTNPAFS